MSASMLYARKDCIAKCAVWIHLKARASKLATGLC